MAQPQYDFKRAFQTVINWVRGEFVTHENMIQGAIGSALELEQWLTGELVPKLDGIEDGAQKNTVTSVNGKTGAVTVTEGIPKSTADSLYLTKTSAQSTYQPKGDYVTATQLSEKGYADAAALANKQDKIKIVTTTPTTSSTSGDPDGTIYLVVG